MNPDPVLTRLREIRWRRELTAAEQAELRAWLAAHPEVQAEWTADVALATLLNRLPDAPMPSNFTARVLEAVEREQTARERTRETPSTRWWRGLLPRATVTIAVVGLALFTYQRHETAHRAELARSLTAVADVESLPSPQSLADYEAIRRLSPAPAADEELLALLQ
jgi:anti-sigma factor RsiW